MALITLFNGSSSTVDNNYDIDTYFFHKIVHARSDLYRSIAISFLLTIYTLCHAMLFI